MYPVSNVFLTAVKQNTRTYYWTGQITITGGAMYDFNQNDIVKGSFFDFIMRYTAASSTNQLTQTAEYYALDPDDGLTMNLCINPLLQFGLEETHVRFHAQVMVDVVADAVSRSKTDVPVDVEIPVSWTEDRQAICYVTYERGRQNGKHSDKCKQRKEYPHSYS